MCLRGQQQQGQRSEKVTAIRMWTGKKLRVGMERQIDGDGNALDGKHGTDVSEKDSYFEGCICGQRICGRYAGRARYQ